MSSNTAVVTGPVTAAGRVNTTPGPASQALRCRRSGRGAPTFDDELDAVGAPGENGNGASVRASAFQ